MKLRNHTFYLLLWILRTEFSLSERIALHRATVITALRSIPIHIGPWNICNTRTQYMLPLASPDANFILTTDYIHCVILPLLWWTNQHVNLDKRFTTSNNSIDVTSSQLSLNRTYAMLQWNYSHYPKVSQTLAHNNVQDNDIIGIVEH